MFEDVPTTTTPHQRRGPPRRKPWPVTTSRRRRFVDVFWSVGKRLRRTFCGFSCVHRTPPARTMPLPSTSSLPRAANVVWVLVLWFRFGFENRSPTSCSPCRSCSRFCLALDIACPGVFLAVVTNTDNCFPRFFGSESRYRPVVQLLAVFFLSRMCGERGDEGGFPRFVLILSLSASLALSLSPCPPCFSLFNRRRSPLSCSPFGVTCV